MIVKPEGEASLPQISSKLFEYSNTEASSFIVDNYDKLEKAAAGMNISPDKASDLVHDVFISVVKSERSGEGYNPDYLGVDSVEKFVYGRMKAYSKSPKYKSDVVEMARVSSSSREPVYSYAVAASFDEKNDKDNNEYDSFQLAYMNANIANTTDEIIDNSSIEEQFEYLLDICSKYDIKVANILKNMDKISSLLNSSKFYRKGLDILKDLKSSLDYNDEAKEALTNVLELSKRDRDAFELLISRY